MRVLTTAAALLGSTVAAQDYVRGIRKPSPMLGNDLVARSNLDECKSVPSPFSCEQSCGPSYSACVFDVLCYNPAAGESCCSDGSFCPAGTYCSDEGCCPNGVSLEECGASTSVSILPPGETLATGGPRSQITYSGFESETSDIQPGTSETQTGTSATQTATSGIQTATSGNQTATSGTDTNSSENQTETSSRTAPTGTGPIPTSPGNITTSSGSIPISSGNITSSGSIPTSTGGNSTVTTADEPSTQPTDNAAVSLKGATGTFVLGWIGVLMALL